MKIFKYIKNTKGVSSVEFVTSLFVFIILFSFIFDLFFIGYKFFAVSGEANKLIRVLSTQSGALSTVPSNYPGGADNYLNVTEFNNRISKKLDNIGIVDYTVKIIVEDNSLSAGERSITLPNSQGLKGDYRKYVKLQITGNYKWSLWSQFIPGDLKGTINVSRTGLGEYKFDYNNWEGEK